METQLKIGMVLIPKPEHLERLSKCLLKTTYVVKQKDIDNNATIGDLWMINPNSAK